MSAPVFPSSSGTSGPSEGGPVQNTDHHLWPQTSEDAYAPSLFVTADGEGIGINVSGSVYVKTLREWHRLAGGPISILDHAQEAVNRGKPIAWLYEMAFYIKPADEQPFRDWKQVVTIAPPPSIPKDGVRNVVSLYASPPAALPAGQVVVTPEMVSAGMAEIPEDGAEYEHVEAAYRKMAALAIPSTMRVCAKCGCETKGEEALVNGEIWCHPCADTVAVTSTPQNTGAK